MNLKILWEILREAGMKWVDDKASRLGAALAFYTVFSIAPLLLIAMAVAGFAFGKEAVEGQLFYQVRGMVGDQGADVIQTMIASASKPASGTLATLFGVLMLLVAAAGLFGQLQDAINTVWGVEPKPGRGIWGFIRDRFLSITMVLGCAFLLLVSLVVSAMLASLATIMGDMKTSAVGQGLDFVISFGVVTGLFAMIYKFLPDVKIAWQDVWLGAAITALLFSIGKWLIGLYIGQSGISSAYGPAGSMAVLLIWLYYSSQIFLFGAELTKAYANRFGSKVVPSENAQAVGCEPQEKALASASPK